MTGRRPHLPLVCLLALGAVLARADDTPPQPAPQTPPPEAAAGYDDLLSYEPARLQDFLNRRLESRDLNALHDIAARLEGRPLNTQEKKLYSQLLDAVLAHKNKLLDPKNAGDPEHLEALTGFQDRLLGIDPDPASADGEPAGDGGEVSGTEAPDGTGRIDTKPAAAAVKTAGAAGADVAAAMDGSLERPAIPLGGPGRAPAPPGTGVRTVAAAAPAQAAPLTFGPDGRGQLPQGFNTNSAAPALPPAAAPAPTAPPGPSYMEAALDWLGRQWQSFRTPPPARTEDVRLLLGKDAVASVKAENRLKEDKAAGQKAVPGLIAALSTGDQALRTRAAAVLMEVGVKRQEDLEALLGVMRGKDRLAGGLALAGLAGADSALLRKNADAVIAALRPSLGPDAPAGRVLAALEVLSALGAAGAQARTEVVAALGHGDPKVRAKAEAALARLDGKAGGAGPSPALGLYDKDRAVRAQALKTLGALGERGARDIVSALLDSDRRDALLWDAREALAQIGKPAVPELVRALRLLREREEKRWAGQMTRDEALRAGAARDLDLRVALGLSWTLAALDPAAAQEAVAWLAKGLEERGTRRESRAALERMGALGLPAFRQALHSGDAELRAETVRDLGRLARGDALYTATLAGALTDWDPDIRAQAIAALAALGPNGREALGPLVAVLDSAAETAANRRAALQALAGLGEGAAERLAEGLLAKSLGAKELDRGLGEAVLAVLVKMGREDLVAKHADALYKKLLEANLSLFVGMREVRRAMDKPLDDAQAAALRARWRELTREHAVSLDGLASAAAALNRHRPSGLGKEVSGYQNQHAALDASGTAIRSQKEKVAHMNGIMDDTVKLALTLRQIGADNSGETNQLTGLGGIGQVPIRTHAKENINSIVWDKAPVIGFLFVAKDDSLSTREMGASLARLGGRINALLAIKDDPTKYELFAERMPVLQKDLEAFAKRMEKYAQAQDDLSKSFVKLTGMVQSLPLMFAGGLSFPAETTLATNLGTRGGLVLFAGTGQAAVDAATARISPNPGAFSGKDAASSFVEGAMFVGFVPGGSHLLQKLAMKHGANSPVLRTAITLTGSMVAMQEYGLAGDFIQGMIATDGDMSQSLARALANMKDQAYERALWGLGFAAVNSAMTEAKIARNEKAARALGIEDVSKMTGTDIIEALQKRLAEGGPGAKKAVKDARTLLAGSEGAEAFLDALEKGLAPERPPARLSRAAPGGGARRGPEGAAQAPRESRAASWVGRLVERVFGTAPPAPSEVRIESAREAVKGRLAADPALGRQLTALLRVHGGLTIPDNEILALFNGRLANTEIVFVGLPEGVEGRMRLKSGGGLVVEVGSHLRDTPSAVLGRIVMHEVAHSFLPAKNGELIAHYAEMLYWEAMSRDLAAHKLNPDLTSNDPRDKGKPGYRSREEYMKGRDRYDAEREALDLSLKGRFADQPIHQLRRMYEPRELARSPQDMLALHRADQAAKVRARENIRRLLDAWERLPPSERGRFDAAAMAEGLFQDRLSEARAFRRALEGMKAEPYGARNPGEQLRALDIVLGRDIGELSRLIAEQKRARDGAAPGRGAQGRSSRTVDPAAPLERLRRLVDDFFDGRRAAVNGVVDPAGPVKHLEDIGALPPEAKARRELVASFAGRFLGLEGPVEVKAPPTPPLSGDQVYYVMQGGKLAAVVKVFASPKGASTLLAELGAGRAIGGLGLKRAQVVEPRGAFRAGPTETLFVMDAAPGRDVYGAMRAVGEAVGAEKRGRALAEAAGDVEAVGRAMGELHRVSRSVSVSPESRRYDVDSAREKLEALRTRLPPDLYAGLKAHVDRLAPAVLSGEGPGALTHGDAHPGNFFVDGARVTLIDVESAMHSLAPGGAKNGNPAGDVGRFLESLHLNNSARGLNLEPREMTALDRAFVTAYLAESGIPITALQREVDFYRLRLALTALTHDPGRMSRYLEEARGLLRELGPAKRAD